jgi:membrane-bound serine protease (ClpP class)
VRATLTIFTLLLVLTPALAQDDSALVLGCRLEGTVDPGSAEYLVECAREAHARGAQALLVELDTPGGSLESTRQIVGAFLQSEVPILVWVGPDGARAGSAGVFITLASNLAGMAQGTNIGAAHPVVGPGGQDPEQAGGSEMARKVENDTVAFARAIAEQRGRNADWAESAVRESASVTAARAVELKIVELIAPSRTAFLEQASGRTVKVGERTVTLNTAGATIEELTPSLRQRVVHWLANPTLAYLLFLAGILGIFMELSNPGLIVPGLVGLISLVLALIAMSALPIQAGAIALLVVGVGLIIAEFFAGNGLLAATGVLLVGLAGVLLVDRFDPEWFVEPSFRVPLAFLIPSTAVLGGLAAYVVLRAAEGRKRPQLGGDVGMVGEAGLALTEIGPEGGQAFVHGEVWSARSDHPIAPQKPVRVRRIDGLILRVDEVTT